MPTELLLGYQPRFVDKTLIVDKNLRIIVLEDILASDKNNKAIITSIEYKARLLKLDKLYITIA